MLNPNKEIISSQSWKVCASDMVGFRCSGSIVRNMVWDVKEGWRLGMDSGMVLR